MSIQGEIGLLGWKIRKWYDRYFPKKLTMSQQDELVAYVTKANNIFRVLQIDVASMLPERQKLYYMMLIYADHDEAVMPSAARTASLINFLDSRKAGFVLPPASQPVDQFMAQEIDNYVAVVLTFNHDGMKDIYDEICKKINSVSATIKR